MKRKKTKPRLVIDGRHVITVEEILGKPKDPCPHYDPVFVNDGSGNGWYVYPDGVWSYVYFR